MAIRRPDSKVQKSGAGRWYLELARDCFWMYVRVPDKPATFIPQTWWAARWEGLSLGCAEQFNFKICGLAF